MTKLNIAETKRDEYKREIPDNSDRYTKTVVAFSNGSGGTITFGVADESFEVVGIPDERVSVESDRISSAICDSCEPMPNFDLKYKVIDDKTIIVLDVFPGAARPYFIKALGMENGTFIRVSGQTRQADASIIQELMLEGTKRSYDRMIAVGETVTDEQIKTLCDFMYNYACRHSESDAKRAAVEKVTKNKLFDWGLLVKVDGVIHPTNGFMLLTDNHLPEAKVQCGVFKGTKRDIFIDKKEYGGAIYDQIDNAFDFVKRNIRMGATVDGLYRQEEYEIPIKSVREIIANAVTHRSYLQPAMVQVALFDDRLEVTSPGMLIGGLSMEEIVEGTSRPRNLGIANALAYMNIIEMWGLGIPRLIDNCKEAGLPKPQLLELGGSFRVNLFRNIDLSAQAQSVNSKATIQDAIQAPKTDQATVQGTAQAPKTVQDGTKDFGFEADLNDCELDVLRCMQRNPRITAKEISLSLKWDISKVKYYIAKLKDKKIIIRSGSSQKGSWTVSAE